MTSSSDQYFLSLSFFTADDDKGQALTSTKIQATFRTGLNWSQATHMHLMNMASYTLKPTFELYQSSDYTNISLYTKLDM